MIIWLVKMELVQRLCVIYYCMVWFKKYIYYCMEYFFNGLNGREMFNLFAIIYKTICSIDIYKTIPTVITKLNPNPHLHSARIIHLLD